MGEQTTTTGNDTVGKKKHRSSDRDYKKAQREFDSVLDPTAKTDKHKKKKKWDQGKYQVSGAEPQNVELGDMFGPTHPDGQYRQIKPLLVQPQRLGQLESDTDGDDNSQTMEPLEQARDRIHALLDEAFLLITPHYSRRNQVTPAGILGNNSGSQKKHGNTNGWIPNSLIPDNRQQQQRKFVISTKNTDPNLVHSTSDEPVVPPGVINMETRQKSPSRSPRRSMTDPPPPHNGEAWMVDQPVREQPVFKGPRHTPMYVKPTSKVRDNGDNMMWNPYEAGDQAAKIPRNQTVPRHQASDKKISPRTQHEYTNPSYTPHSTDHIDFGGSRSIPRSTVSSLATEPAEPIKIRTRTPKDIREALQPTDYTSITMDASVFAPESYKRPPNYHDQAYTTPPKYHTVVEMDSTSGNIPRSPKSPRAFKPYSEAVFMQHPQIKSQDTSSSLSQSAARLQQQPMRSHNTSSSKKHSHSQPPEKNQAWGDRSHDLRQSHDPDDFDERDIVDRVMKPGSSAQPLVNSIREELQKLATKTGGSTGINAT